MLFGIKLKPSQLLIWGLSLLGCILLVRFNVRGLAGAPTSGLPDYFIFPGNDLVVYLRAGQALAAGESPYPAGYWRGPDVFHYSPAAALFLKQFIKNPIPFRRLAYIHLGLILAAYPLAWLAWRAVFKALNLKAAATAMVMWLPLWLVYSQWFADQNFLNIYTFLLLLDGLLLLAILRQQTMAAIILAVLIAQTKPHYLYPLILPLLLGRWRFLAKLSGGFLFGYIALAGATILTVGPAYGLSLYRDYATFLTTIAERYPWSDFYLGYNHSWQSILNWLFGRQTWVPTAVTGIRLILLLPWGYLGWRWWQTRHFVEPSPAIALGLTLAAHLWAIASLDQLWEVTTALVVFPYLLATGSRPVRRTAILIFVPFALFGLAQLIGWKVAALSGLPGDQFDVTAQLPVMMITALGLYGLTLGVVQGQQKKHDSK